MLRELRDSRFALATLLAALNVLNVVDLLLTFRLLGGRVVEGNPIMRVLIGSDPLVALIVKVVIVAAVSIGVWRQRRYRVVLAASLVFLGAFVILTAYELGLVFGT